MTLWTIGNSTPDFWVDAADRDARTLISDGVSELQDKSGNDFHAGQGTAAKRPTIAEEFANGLDVLDFNGSSHVLQTAPNILRFEELTLFAVYLTHNRAARQGVLTKRHPSDSGFPHFEYRYGIRETTAGTDGKTDLHWYSTGDADGLIATTPVESDVLVMELMTIQSSQVERFQNGAADGSKSTSVANTTTDKDSGNVLYLGASRHDVRFLHGKFAEAAIWGHALDSDTISKVFGYAAHKWGIAASLPAEHPYKSAAPSLFSISGTITDEHGNPAQRTVYAMSRQTDGSAPVLLGHGESDPTTGAYELILPTDDEVTRIVLAEDQGEPGPNDPVLPDLVDRVIPG